MSTHLTREQQARRDRRDSSGALAPPCFEASVTSDLANTDEIADEVARELALFEHVFADFGQSRFGVAVKKEPARARNGEPVVIDISGVDGSVLEKLKRELPAKREPDREKAAAKREPGVEKTFVDLIGLETVIDLVERELPMKHERELTGPVLVNFVGMGAVIDLTSVLATPSSSCAKVGAVPSTAPNCDVSGASFSGGENVNPNMVEMPIRRSKRIATRKSNGCCKPMQGGMVAQRRAGVRGRASNSVFNSRYAVPNPTSMLGAWVYYYSGPITRNRARLMGRRPESF